MAKDNERAASAAHILYEAYPDHDLLPIEPPQPGETIAEFKLRAEGAGDTLFLFLCREADDEIDADEYVERLDRAIRDIENVRDAFSDMNHPSALDCDVSAADNEADAETATPSETIRLVLDGDWIEVTVAPADAQGRRSVRPVVSTYRTHHSFSGWACMISISLPTGLGTPHSANSSSSRSRCLEWAH